MPDFIQLQTFVLTAELGSLAAAARKLAISSAAVSKQLTRLEKELGVQLLVRTTRTIELTEIGENYLIQCKRILEEVEGASSLISQVKVIPHGRLKIVSTPHFAHSYIIPNVKEFLTLFPEIEVDLELAERIPDLNAEGIDVLFGMSISATGEVIQKKIATSSYVYCASPDYLKKSGIPKNLKELKSHRYITHSMRKAENELLFKDKQITLTPYLRVNDSHALLKFALDGLGIVKLHRYAVDKYLEQGRLKQILSTFNTAEIPIYVAYPQRRFISSKIRCFIDFILKKVK